MPQSVVLPPWEACEWPVASRDSLWANRERFALPYETDTVSTTLGRGPRGAKVNSSP
jgi:hypothetical protein